MRRRRFVIGVGSAAVAGGAAFGTGAFSSVAAERDFAVNVTGDASALLRIAPAEGPNGAYATGADEGALTIDVTGSNHNVEGDGVNSDAVTYFDEVFLIENQGAQPVKLTVSPLAFVELGSGVLLVLLVPLDAPAFGGNFDPFNAPAEADITAGSVDDLPLGVGDETRFGMMAATYGGTDGSELGFADELEIEAEAIDNVI